jgi:hypothetical protein
MDKVLVQRITLKRRWKHYRLSDMVKFSIQFSSLSVNYIFIDNCIELLMSLKKDLVIKILEIAKQGTTKSEIYNSITFVSESQINRTLAYIINNRMLHFTETNFQYMTTHRGFTYLEKRYKEEKDF